jgi:hypothetical protein
MNADGLFSGKDEVIKACIKHVFEFSSRLHWCAVRIVTSIKYMNYVTKKTCLCGQS